MLALGSQTISRWMSHRLCSESVPWYLVPVTGVADSFTGAAWLFTFAASSDQGRAFYLQSWPNLSKRLTDPFIPFEPHHSTFHPTDQLNALGAATFRGAMGGNEMDEDKIRHMIPGQADVGPPESPLQVSSICNLTSGVSANQTPWIASD